MSRNLELAQLAKSLTVDATGTITDLNIDTTAIEELPDINLAIAPEVLEIQVDAPAAGQNTAWLWTWEQSTLPYARRTITNSNELNVPLYKQGTYVVNNFAAYDIHGSMTQTHSLYLKWIDGAGTDNLISWATSAGPISDTHASINGGAATDVQRITVNVPSTVTLPTLTNPSVSYTVVNSGSGSYTFSGAASGDNPNIGPFYRGGTYTINISATGHPFYFTTDNGTNFAAGTYFGEYTSGVTGSRNDTGSITFTVPANAPDTLYYQCGNHSVMRGEITVKDLAVETNINGNYVVYFQHTQEGHKTPVELRPIPSLVNQMCLVYDSTSGKFVPQDLATYVENTPSFENKIREVAGTAELVVEDGSAVIAKVNVYDDSTYLPLTGNNPGDQAFATDTDILYIWDGSAWQQAGAANSDDLTEGSTNLFFTNARADARIAAATTTDLTEGTNLYYTDARADARAQLKIDALVDSAPGTLDTLNELAAALGDDANFSTTVTNSIATKLPLAGGTMTGALIVDAGDAGLDVRLGTDKRIIFAGNIGEIGNVAGFQTVNTAGSANTAFGIRATDIRFATGSDERMRINSSGNVGIGTSSPNTALQVSTPVTTKSVIETTGTSSDALIEFTRGQGSGNTWSVGLDQSNASALSFAYLANGSPSLTTHNKLTIDSSGNMGIGTDNPSTKLHVNGNIRASTLYQEGGDSASSAMVVSQGVNTTRASVAMWSKDHGSYPGQVHIVSHSANSSADSGKIMFWDYNGSAWNANGAWDKTGNFGIGTTSPTDKLHVSGGAFKIDTDANSSFTIGDGGTDAITLYGGTGDELYMGANNAYSLRFKTDGNIVMDNGGNFGIGLTNPDYKLDVGGIGTTQLRLKSSGDTGYTQGSMVIESSNSASNPGNRGQGIYYYNVPNQRTWYTGTLYNNGNKFGFGYRQVSGFQVDAADNLYAMMVLDGDNGNVGIGEAKAPVAPLDIFPGSTNGTMYDALVLRGGANSTQGSGVRLHMSGTGNDALSRGVILQSEMTNNANNHDFSVWTSQASAHTKKFTIDNQGQVAIGANAPSGTRLHIQVPNSGSGLTDAVKIEDSSGYTDIAMYVGAADGEIRLGAAGQLRGKISGGGVGSRTDHNFDLYQNSNIAASLRSSINGTGRRGLHMLGNSLGFDQSGVRSWEMRAADGNLRMDSGDGYGKVQVSAGFKAKSIQLGNDSAHASFGAQSGYMGDWWEAGHKAVYYLGYLGSSASTPGTANWFNFYTSGHWGQYTRVMVYSINHYPSPGYSKWDINGTTVNQVEGRGSVGSVTSTQSTVSSNGHSGQPVYKYTVQLTMPGTYTQGPWFVAHMAGGGAGHLSNAHTDAQADAWFSTRGGGMHLRNISTDAMKTSPMYVTGT